MARRSNMSSSSLLMIASFLFAFAPLLCYSMYNENNQGGGGTGYNNNQGGGTGYNNQGEGGTAYNNNQGGGGAGYNNNQGEGGAGYNNNQGEGGAGYNNNQGGEGGSASNTNQGRGGYNNNQGGAGAGGEKEGGGGGEYNGDYQLHPQFYQHSCPQAEKIIRSVVEKAWQTDPRMAASLLRLTFHDCFVQGCDASLLLDSSGVFLSEKRSNPNRDSARGFEVIDEIKAALEKECPITVSCADIIQIAARDSVVLTGGPNWEVPLGRRDALTPSLSGSNNNIPAANLTFQSILSKFNAQGLDLIDLVALSGAHTIGDARCVSFRQRLYNQNGNGQPDSTLDKYLAQELRQRCPSSGSDQTLFFLDYTTPFHFDNAYYMNLIHSKGLLNSDEVLFTQNGESMELVKKYAYDQGLFFDQFVKSMVKMGNVTPLTGDKGEIRRICRRVNKVDVIHY